MWATDESDAMWSRRRVLGLGAAATAALLAGCGSSGDEAGPNAEVSPVPSTDWGGTLLDPPFTKPDVTFTDVEGRPFSLREDTAGRLSVLFFGFTNCPDVCPVYLGTIASARRELGTGDGSDVQVLFVGVDRKRDTPEVLKTYLGNIDETFIGLSGTDAEVLKATTALKVAPVEIGEPAADGSYDVGHPARVFAFSPDGLGHRLYSFDIEQQQWVKDLPRLAQGSWA
ncbi:SCO family protein [Aquihabitans sp. G128]|uniref:SCO family protein n=1 Tax=Aquihabitans sp. G128 TaxID=2849779 RepID=UPI001C24FD6E|nr:SCO family protein [Aquihabitans sp. G128]QXC60590.1 SCO family protein [Aquihabitans sp. G128]